MSKKNARDYSDFINFAKSRRGVLRTQIFKQYEQQGGHIQKKTALKIVRDLWGIEKGELIRQSSYAKNDISPIIEKSKGKKSKGKKAKIKRQIHRFDFEGEKVLYSDIKSPAVNSLYKNIRQLYETDNNVFIKIRMKVMGDSYSVAKQFSIMIPFDGKKKPTVKQLGNKVIQNLKIYYSNLAKRYTTKVESLSSVLDNVKMLKDTFDDSRNLDRQGMLDLFKKSGFNIQNIDLFGIDTR